MNSSSFISFPCAKVQFIAIFTLNEEWAREECSAIGWSTDEYLSDSCLDGTQINELLSMHLQHKWAACVWNNVLIDQGKLIVVGEIIFYFGVIAKFLHQLHRVDIYYHGIYLCTDHDIAIKILYELVYGIIFKNSWCRVVTLSVETLLLIIILQYGQQVRYFLLIFSYHMALRRKFLVNLCLNLFIEITRCNYDDRYVLQHI